MEGKLRVIHVVNVRWFNATAWYALYLARLMKDAGHEVMVLGLGGTDSFSRAQQMGLEPVSLPLNTQNPLRLFSLYRTLSALVHRFQPHVVNCHRGENFAMWAALKKRFGFCLVRTRGDQRPPKGGIINRFLHNTVADGVIATNSAMAQAMGRTLDTPASRVSIIVGGVDRERFRFTAEGRRMVRERCGFPLDALVFGILGRFDHVKGQKELIEAFARLRAFLPSGSDTRLMLAGFPTEVSEADIRGWLAAAHLEPYAVITGRCDDVAACISAMDVGVVASLGSEAIARAALEIMSCGIPLVSTRIGVMPDLLPEEAVAVPGNNAALMELLRKAAVDIPWRENLRRMCLERIGGLSGEDFLRETLAAYGRAMGDG